MSNQPTHKVKIGLITATIWDNNGFYSVDIARSYKSAESEWKSTTSFAQGDLLNLAKCAERAEIWVSRHTLSRQ